MATIKRFEDLEIWQEARRLSQKIIEPSEKTNLRSDFRCKEQIKSAAGSVMDNIAEGFERDGNLEFRQFLSIAKGSAGEVRSRCFRLLDSKYLSDKESNILIKEYEQLSKRIAGFINYLNKKDFKGNKFK
jgi:four helix bundle protein